MELNRQKITFLRRPVPPRARNGRPSGRKERRSPPSIETGAYTPLRAVLPHGVRDKLSKPCLGDTLIKPTRHGWILSYLISGVGPVSLETDGSNVDPWGRGVHPTTAEAPRI